MCVPGDLKNASPRDSMKITDFGKGIPVRSFCRLGFEFDSRL
jgi:hypothetical protein